jgi:ubiquinone/menaquinone biosynthesis C-methylase UbiE
MSDASEWERTATERRPWRSEFFEKFADELKGREPKVRRVLELGSGPGFLASHLLGAMPDVHMVLLDFSSAMHDLARRRLGPMTSHVDFLEKSFKDADWSDDLKSFDAVVTNQAVHELRHERYAVELHRQVRAVLRSGGSY